jgi:hypothetical protein
MADVFQDVFQQMVQRARVDAEFHKTCLTDPERAFRESAGMELPMGARLRFLYTMEGGDLVPLYVPPGKAV